MSNYYFCLYNQRNRAVKAAGVQVGYARAMMFIALLALHIHYVLLGVPAVVWRAVIPLAAIARIRAVAFFAQHAAAVSRIGEIGANCACLA